MRRLVLLGVLLVAACTSPVMMRNPQTGATAQCGPYSNTGIVAASSAQREAQCIRDFKEQGYVRVSN